MPWKKNALALFNKQMDVPITKNNISVCHTLRRRSNDSINGNNQQRDIIVRFVSRRSKTAVMRNARRLKGTKIYGNEHLTTKNATHASYKKKTRLLSPGCGTAKCLLRLSARQKPPKPTSSLKKVTLSG